MMARLVWMQRYGHRMHRHIFLNATVCSHGVLRGGPQIWHNSLPWNQVFFPCSVNMANTSAPHMVVDNVVADGLDTMHLLAMNAGYQAQACFILLGLHAPCPLLGTFWLSASSSTFSPSLNSAPNLIVSPRILILALNIPTL